MSSNFKTWFESNTNGKVTRFETKSTWGFLLALPLFCGLFGIILFLLFKIYSILFTVVGSGLGISAGLEIWMWVTAICCAKVNIPLSWHRKIGINVTGGLMPTILALYQFSRIEANPIFVVMVLVAAISFFSVVVVPELGILSKPGSLKITSLVAAVCAIWMATPTDRVGVAFAGSVLGCLIGADLFHLKDLQLKKSLTPISIGGAGMEDGIISCGFTALLFAEYLPKLVSFFTSNN